MLRKSSYRKIFLILSCFFFALNITRANPMFEFRGVWVATVTNIDWPSRQGLDANTLKAEAIKILDLHQELGMNAIILQVRPASDAIYPSALEPWTKYLSGIQGVSPGGAFDPLKFWIEEAHKRGMELHAWINPFRAAMRSDEPLHSSHPAALNPHWTINYANRLYYNPGLAEVRNHIRLVIADLVSRYNIDGLHMDDYFYPYPVRGEIFDDSLTFNQSIKTNKDIGIDDWRRENINIFIKETYETIKKIKPWVKFGVSPFGVWRNRIDDPRGSDSRAGVTCYDHLYADVLYWYEKGWIDYLVPQIYWSTKDEAANYTKLANWWNDAIKERHLYIGHGIYKINGTQAHWDNPSEMKEQINITRKLRNTLGSVYFSHRHFERDNNGLNKSLSQDLYRNPALTPAMPWLAKATPNTVKNIDHRKRVITWQMTEATPQMNQSPRYIVFFKPAKGGNEQWIITNNPFIRTETLSSGKRTRYNVQVVTLDRLNNMSPRSETIRIRF